MCSGACERLGEAVSVAYWIEHQILHHWSVLSGWTVCYNKTLHRRSYTVLHWDQPFSRFYFFFFGENRMVETNLKRLIWGVIAIWFLIKLSLWGEQEWQSGENTPLLPMWPGFESLAWRHLWIEGDVIFDYRLCFESSPPPPESESHMSVSWDIVTCNHFPFIIVLIYFIINEWIVERFEIPVLPWCLDLPSSQTNAK